MMKKNERTLGRRGFLILSGAGATSMAFASSAMGREAVNLLDSGNPLIIPQNFKPSIWFTMEANGRTTVHVIRAEIGQHIGTAYAQIVAEELELDWDRVTIDYPEIDANTMMTYGAQITGGSYSVHEMFDWLARTAAAARGILVEAGADLLGADPADCIAKNGKVVDEVYGESISYSDILSETTIDYEVYEEDLGAVKLKAREDYRIIGTSVPALDIPEKVNGSARFGIDAYVPNMVYGKIIVPPRRLGAKIVSINDDAAKSISGYLTTMPINLPEGGLVSGLVTHTPLVIAKSFPAAMRAAEVIEVEWDVSGTSSISSEDMVSEAHSMLAKRADEHEVLRIGDMGGAEATAVQTFERVYETSMVAHVPMEPMSALANFSDGKLHLYSGHQYASLVPMTISNFTGLDPQNIIFHPHLIGGGFGKRGEMEPLILSSIAAIQMKMPVKVIFTREDDMAFAHPRTPTVQKMRGFLDADNNLSGTTHDIAGGWMGFYKLGIDFGMITTTVDGKPKPSPAGSIEAFSVLGSDHWYDVPNQRVCSFRQHSIEKTVPVRAVRSVANNYTLFAIESFIDEIAADIGRDPLEFRLSMLRGLGHNAGPNAKHIEKSIWPQWLNYSPYQKSSAVGGGKRLANVLRIASGVANYGSKVLPENTAQGIAISGAEERQNPAFTACVAEVHVDPASAAIDVRRLTLAIDVGVIVNPDGVRSQVEGSLLWGLSNTMREKMTVREGAIAERNFDSYSWQANSDLPEIDIHLVENGLYPSGVGEPATSIVAPALANAVARASGIRLRSLPLDRQSLMDQLSA
jgi:isoquinoline 1-oxidoreductase